MLNVVSLATAFGYTECGRFLKIVLIVLALRASRPFGLVLAIEGIDIVI